ncbi:hypothetical protein VB773_14145 [Haloarculaceae archaeon H-GB2-1]|nr:hypothetical protein [Haloarculaceae archaeon H-GB1-1]MEA5408596.1 hypothetical protein [Haloarculaceae archaeon H-GB2-1]
MSDEDRLADALERIADAVETQNALLLEHIRTTEFVGLDPEERYSDRGPDPRTTGQIDPYVRDAEAALGYRSLHGRVRDVEKQDQAREDR